MSRKNSPKDFEFETCIGEGSYSKVYKAVSIHNHRTYAIKVLNKAHIVKEKKIKYVNIEKNTLNKLGHHPGIVTLHYTFQDSESLYYVIDFALNGELLSLIRKWGSLSEPVTKYYAIQLIDAVEFIHSKGIIHRDLKPENILLNRDWKLMITDFGAAKILDENLIDQLETKKTEVGDSRTGSFVGTAEYVSPELLKYNQCGFECDYWAIGCILYQLLTGYPPFKGNTEYLTFEKIIKLDYKFPEYYVPSKFKHLVSSLLVLKPEDRYNMKNIKADDWFQDLNWSNKDLIWKRKVPKFESYNPRYYQQKKDSSPVITQKTRFDSSKFYVPQGLQLQSNINSIPNHILKRQIMTPQTNQQAMNKALTQRLIMKTNELNLQQRNAASLASAAANATRNGSKNMLLPKLESSNFQPVNRLRSSTTSALKQNTLKKLKPVMKASISLPVANTATAPLTPSPTIPTSQSQSSLLSKASTNGSTTNRSPSNTINSMGNLMKKSFSSNILNSKTSRSRSKSVTPPVSTKSDSELLVTLPLQSQSDIPLLADEYILKADSIYKSELPFSLAPIQRANLDDTVLNKLINDHYSDLTNEIKPSLLIITSLGRLLIYEFTQPDELEESTATDKETNLIVVNLTNKNISMYEFDGVFIIKDDYSPNIIFLSPTEKIHDSSNSAVKSKIQYKPDIKINLNVSWIETLLKAKELLKSSASNSPSSSSEFSSADNDISVSPIDEIEYGISRLSTQEPTVTTPKLQQLGNSLPRTPLNNTPTGKTRSVSRSGALAKPSVISTPSPQSAGPPRSSSNSSISYHYTQQQKSQPHAHQANFSFLSQTKQNKFASAAAAASFRK